MKTKPDLGFWKLWNLSFGFFGVQIAYALQSSQVSRIFSTIGADPHDLSFFWILPPLMGMIVQPIVGSMSDKTWTRLGRRLPYLLLGAVTAIIVMCLLPNAGSLGLSLDPTWLFGWSSVIIFGLIMLMLLDTTINMAMQPFKMLVGDMVNEKQKGLAYSIQSFLCNAGSVVGYLLPFVLAGTFLGTQIMPWTIASEAAPGVVPPTVVISFYIGAAVLLFCVIYTFAKVKEWPPQLYNEYNAPVVTTEAVDKPKGNLLTTLRNAPRIFWTVGLVQFFCWAAFLYMWAYSADAIAGHSFNAPTIDKVQSITVADATYEMDKSYLFSGQTPLVEKGSFKMAGVKVDSTLYSSDTLTVAVDGVNVLTKGKLEKGYQLRDKAVEIAKPGQKVTIDGKEVAVAQGAQLLSSLANLPADAPITYAAMMSRDQHTGEYFLTDAVELGNVAGAIQVTYSPTLNAASKEYQQAGDWNGVLLAVQGLVAVLWAMMLPRFRNRRVAYSVSLLIGGIGFLSIYFITNQVLLFVSYGLAGVAWAAMLALPFTLLTNALRGGNIGTYLGLFNCTICLPQIVASIVGGRILALFPVSETGVTETVNMLYVSGALLLIGAIAVWGIKEAKGQDTIPLSEPEAGPTNEGAAAES